jgi:hypothetical protein
VRLVERLHVRRIAGTDRDEPAQPLALELHERSRMLVARITETDETDAKWHREHSTRC